MKINKEGTAILNGSFDIDIRIQTARYGGGFNAIGIVWDCCGLDDEYVHKIFNQLSYGDNDYFESRDWLESQDTIVFMQNVSLDYISENMDKMLYEMLHDED